MAKPEALRRRGADSVPRPLCACGKDATHEVRIEVQELKLERAAGLHARPYWDVDYRNSTRVQSRMCGACVRENIRIDVKVDARVDAGAEKKP